MNALTRLSRAVDAGLTAAFDELWPPEPEAVDDLDEDAAGRFLEQTAQDCGLGDVPAARISVTTPGVARIMGTALRQLIEERFGDLLGPADGEACVARGPSVGDAPRVDPAPSASDAGLPTFTCPECGAEVKQFGSVPLVNPTGRPQSLSVPDLSCAVDELRRWSLHCPDWAREDVRRLADRLSAVVLEIIRHP